MTRIQLIGFSLCSLLVSCDTTRSPSADDLSDFRSKRIRRGRHDMAMSGADPAAGPDLATGSAADLGVSGDLSVAAGGGGGGAFGSVAFPWPVFDGTIPDTPVSSTGKTWYVDAKNGN